MLPMVSSRDFVLEPEKGDWILALFFIGLLIDSCGKER